MYLSYAQHPELQIFDQNACRIYPKCIPQIWDGFNFDNLGNVRIYKGDELQSLDEQEKRLAIVELKARMDSDISLGRFSEQDFRFYLVSRPFFEAMTKTYKKLRHLMDGANALRDIFEDSVFIIGDRTLVFMRLSDNRFRYMEFQQGRLAHISDFSIGDKGSALDRLQDMETMTVFDFQGYDDVWTPDLVLYQQSFILFFKKYADVELETVGARKTLRRSAIFGEKVNNFMDIDVQVLDSSWFTTICRDEGFMVSGHFRLQPCKVNGEWTRKLIYINPYAKHGYHRLAKKESNENIV
ncbi:MAG: hypothetical protein IKX61_02455 [Prevotella sp.]|nr:hypothetical protein [Prevotella sp.]